MANITWTTDREIIGYDTSNDAHDLSVICADCAEERGDEGGSPIYAGDEWGVVGDEHRCKYCRADLSDAGLIAVY